jgi:xylulokinase
LWDVRENEPASFLLDYFGFPSEILPEVRDTFSVQGRVTEAAARELGIPAGIPVAYRAGDQPNNAFSLNVLQPGELAATAGTSGVVYGVAGGPVYDDFSRVNTFVHVNHRRPDDRFGVLLCVNGTGILNRWVKQNCLTAGNTELSYPEMNDLGMEAPVGAEGLMILPYGNGAERRTLKNNDPGGSVHNLNFNIHTQAHLIRAAQEGIVYALKYGLDIMEAMGLDIKTVKAGDANMFLSPLFQEAFSTVTGTEVVLYNTDGAQGAARGAGIGSGLYASFEEAFAGLEEKGRITPSREKEEMYGKAYERWFSLLQERGIT